MTNRPGAPAKLKVVITGATGNIGSQVVEQLLDHPAVGSVVGMCRRPPASHSDVERLSYVSLDLLDASAGATLERVTAGADVVIHLAWRIQPSHDGAAMRRINVEGTRAVTDAAINNAVPSLVYASSLGAYSGSRKDVRRDETWPTAGIPTSTYSRQKAEVESILDDVEQRAPSLRVVRLRPGIVLQRRAGSEIARYFIGPLVPLPLLRPGVLPIVPDLPGLKFQVVHSADVAAAFVKAVTTDVAGAFNIATDPPLDAARLGRLMAARVVPVPTRALRAAVTLGWRLRLTPTDAGWLDMAMNAPVMDTARAKDELDWEPRHDADSTLLELLEGLTHTEGGATPVLAALPDGVRRVTSAFRHLLSGGIGK
jgi:nucleoside-diphosphate-sugar epimerase